MSNGALSLRQRIFLGTSLALTVVVAIGAVAVWLAAHAVLYRALDQDVLERARSMGARVAARSDATRPARLPRPAERRTGEVTPPGGPTPWNPSGTGPVAGLGGTPPDLRADGGTVFIQIVDGDGQEVARSPSLASDESLIAGVPSDHTSGCIHSVFLRDQRPVRLTSQRLPPLPPGSWPPWLTPQPGTVVRERSLQIVVAIDASAVVSDLQRLGMVLACLWLVTTALGLAVALWLHRTILRPLTSLSQGIAALGPDDLHARLLTADVPREMQVVPQRLNDLLTRLEAAFLREKTTLANIAHELRTPITGLRMTLELALADELPPAQAATLRTCLRITESMQGMIANLLTLAKLDAGDQGLPSGECPLEETARTVWSLLAARATERSLQITWHSPDDLMVRLTSEQAQMVLGNLLDNAVSYASPGSSIALRIEAIDRQACLSVENQTDQAVNDLSQVFVAFWRGDQSRTGGLHCGLGLALVQRLVTALGGRVEANAPAPNRFRVRVWLPIVR